MNKNMNAAPAFPDIKDTTPDGWANLASGLVVPESAVKGDTENGMMTRDERIADGQEKINALKTKAKEGLSKMMKGLKDRIYIGVSRGAELPGQIASGAEMVRETIAQKSTEAREVVGQKSSDAKEALLQKGVEAKEVLNRKGVETKEAISNAWGAARGKAAELFEKGNDVILQNVKVARERKAARIERRQKRREARQEMRDQRVAELDDRQADRESRREARQQRREDQSKENMTDKLSDGDDKMFIKREQQADSGATLESMMTNRELDTAEKEEVRLRQEAELAAQAAEAARLKADANPENERLQIDAEEQEGLSIAANARLKRAAGEVAQLKTAISQLDKRSETAQHNIESAQERIEERRGRAEARRAARMADRREALGDTWVSAKDRIVRLVNTDPDKIKQFGIKVAKASGRLAKTAAGRLVPAS